MAYAIPRGDTATVGFSPHLFSPSELTALLAAERRGDPFLAYRDPAGDLRLALLRDVAQITVGRADDNDVVLAGDPEVSRTHAQLGRVGAAWTLVDDGLSRNGCFVNGERVQGRKRLADGDMLRFGRTPFVFRAPGVGVASTVAATAASFAHLTDAEHRVLTALCRPLLAPGAAAAPASNREIADRLTLSEAGVKTHIRALFDKLGVEALPQNRKRAELARRALEAGLVTARTARD
jgi:DNA-binding CsgD family transcriptional regulator